MKPCYPDNLAFPSNHLISEQGLSKREYFAIHILTAIIENPANNLWPSDKDTEYAVAKADALIAALNKEPTGEDDNG